MPPRFQNFLLAFALLALTAAPAAADDNARPDWLDDIRDDRPRLYFNADQWDDLRSRAEGQLSAHFERLRERVDDMPREPEVDDWGDQVIKVAFVQQVTGDDELLELVVAQLEASMDFYEKRYAAEEPVNWYARTRIDWMAALDMVWGELEPATRETLARRMLDHVNAFETVGRHIPREAKSPPVAGFYGMQSAFWFAGVLLHGEGIDDDAAEQLLIEGSAQYEQMLNHRSEAVGDEGGSATASLNYALATYPLSEWRYFHSRYAAMGDQPWRQWDYPALLPEYLRWNWIPGGLEHGYGDVGHTTNRITGNLLYTHMMHIAHFFGDTHPDQARLAHHMAQKAIDADFSSNPNFWQDHYPIYRNVLLPYLLDPHQHDLPEDPPKRDGMVRFFQNMGQVFIRTGDTEDDTFILISCDGILDNHRHYDAGHFTIYHRGFLALDAGTRLGEGNHLENYYAQTIAHNTLLIEMPGEEPPRFWGREPEVHQGGQYRLVGSEVVALDSDDDWVYVACELTPVYHPDKAEQVLREFVFLAPDILIVFDSVISTQAEYGKTWLLQTALEPAIDGPRITAEQDAGRLISTTLLPEDAQLEPVGGPGKEFLVAGRNFEIPEQYLENGEVPELMGRWRVEVSPGEAREHDLFLHVLEIGDQSRESTAEPAVRVRDNRVLLRLNAHDEPVELRLNRNQPGGTLTWPERNETHPLQ